MKRRIKKILIVAVIFPMVAAAFIGSSYRVASGGEPEKEMSAIERIVTYLKGRRADIKEENLKAVVSTVCDQAQRHDLDYRLALALIKVESNFRQDVVSRKGATGLFQIKPSLAKNIARDAGVDCQGPGCLREPDKNIKLGVYHLSKLVGDFKSLPSALHAYNVGTGSAKTRAAGKGEPKTPFTRRVLKEYESNLSVLPDADQLDK
jgi:soluble lytic murein transglycosylase